MSTNAEGQAMSAARRRERIRRLIDDQRYVGVADLSERFGVSEVTIRSDLERLQDQGKVDRVRGGAIGARTAVEQAFAVQLGEHAEEKAAIARAAVELFEPAEAIFLDAGTTTTALARELVTHRDDLDRLVVVTNSLPVALELEEVVGTFEVVVTGGTLRPMQHSLVDPLAGRAAELLRVDTMVMGCTGVDVEAGITNINSPEAAVKLRWHRRAERTVVLADGSKLGARTLAAVCPLEEIDVLVTDAGAPDAMVSAVRRAGIAVIVAASGE